MKKVKVVLNHVDYKRNGSKEIPIFRVLAEVDGYLLDFKTVKIAVHKTPTVNSGDQAWTATEMTTGLRLVRGRTKKETITLVKELCKNKQEQIKKLAYKLVYDVEHEIPFEYATKHKGFKVPLGETL